MDDHAEVMEDSWGWCRERCQEKEEEVYRCDDIDLESMEATTEIVDDDTTTVNISWLEREMKPLCLANGSCSGRCGGGSDLNCWCDDR